jgi:hypothetical protein
MMVPRMMSYSGSGESIGDPIVIFGVKTDLQAVDAEYEYLAKRFGRKDTDWKLVLQSLLDSGRKKIDSMEIELANGKRLTLYFDITKYFGVFEESDISNLSTKPKKNPFSKGVSSYR